MTSLRDIANEYGISPATPLSLEKFIAYGGRTRLKDTLRELRRLRDSDTPVRASIPIEPGLGGRFIDLDNPDPDDLQEGDLILATTAQHADLNIPRNLIESSLNRSTASKITHPLIYVGNNGVSWVSRGQVVVRPLITAIEDADTVVVIRYQPNLTEKQGYQVDKLISFASNSIDHSIRWATVNRTYFRLDVGTWCAQPSDRTKQKECRAWLGHVNLGTTRTSEGFFRFFCSDFVLKAYKRAEVHIIDPDWEEEEPEINLTGSLGYVGHIRVG